MHNELRSNMNFEFKDSETCVHTCLHVFANCPTSLLSRAASEDVCLLCQHSGRFISVQSFSCHIYSKMLVFWFSSIQDGIYALGKTHMRSTPSLTSFPNVAFETVPVFVWLTMALSRPSTKIVLALPLSTPLSSRRSMVWCPWLCARRWCLKFLNT